MYYNIFSLLSGLIFGLGLIISGMTNPSKVLSFLNITKNWDPSLIFVMGGAIFLTAPIFYFSRNKQKPFFSNSFKVPMKKYIDRNLLIGASIFGIGWGMVGLCPGPAISSIIFLKPLSLFFLFSMISGFYISKFISL